jgi:hypothetical protein
MKSCCYMGYFHNFIIPHDAILTLKRLTMTSYYEVRRICYSVLCRWPTSLSVILTKRTRQSSNTQSFFFFLALRHSLNKQYIREAVQMCGKNID